MESSHGSAQTLRPQDASVDQPWVGATSPLRLLGYALVLVAMAFSQRGSELVADTKFDLVTAPGTFLERGLHLWDPTAAFGQLQNQAYGYLWPMGPFFWLGNLVHFPAWAIQRAWWALLLLLAFFGILLIARKLRLGSPFTQVMAAAAYVLTPRITSILGSTSVEVWPMAIAPWVLLALMWGTSGGSRRKSAAMAALAVACAGGVNAVAVAATLPLGVLWLLTRSGGSEKWKLLGWWTGFTVVATAWWWAPLLLLGRYSPPFLDYIENARITTLPTDISRTLLGVSDWVAYFAGADFPAGSVLVSTSFLLIDAAAIAAAGLVGVGLASNPHRRFLILGVLSGVMLVGFGYSGDLSGFFADQRHAMLDGSLAPLRNLHKFDVVLRIPLVLGMAHALQVVPKALTELGADLGRRVLTASMGLAVMAMTLPWLSGVVAPGPGGTSVPGFWRETAAYLAENDDGTVALELPASAFGVYIWGNVHDDVMQGLARSPWAVRNAIPLAQPGNVRFLDTVTNSLESGRPDPDLAAYLAANGVGRLVIRNDLDRLITGAPDPAMVRSVLQATPGLRLETAIGPKSGGTAYHFSEGEDGKQVRVTSRRGMDSVGHVIEIYSVQSSVTATLTSSPKVLVGDPSQGKRSDIRQMAGSSVLAASDARVAQGQLFSNGQVLTDGLARRELNFASVRWNQSATMPASMPYALAGKEHSHRIGPDEEAWQTTEIWSGDVSGVWASSSQAYATAIPPLDPGSLPAAAFDSDMSTSWASDRHQSAAGQWWEADFVTPRAVTQVSLTLAPDSVRVPSLRFQAGRSFVQRTAPKPGQSATYELNLPSASSLRISAVGQTSPVTGSVAIQEVQINQLHGQRLLQLPKPVPNQQIDLISLNSPQGRNGCTDLAGNFVCLPIVDTASEDGDVLARRFEVPVASTYVVSATASLRRTREGWPQILDASPATITASGDPGPMLLMQPEAMIDGDLGTTWTATDAASFEVTFRAPTLVRSLGFEVNPAAGVSAPKQVQVSDDEGRSKVLDVGPDQTVRLGKWETTSLKIKILKVDTSFDFAGLKLTKNPPGLSELAVNGQSLNEAAGMIHLPCGQGPSLLIAGQSVPTSLDGAIADLKRGASVSLNLCGANEFTVGGTTDVIAKPSAAFRADSVSMVRVGATPAKVTPISVRRDSHGAPASVRISQAPTNPELLVLPRNFNAGWQATLGGQALAPLVADGWKQAWIVPAGSAGEVSFEFTPQRGYVARLLVGLLGLLLCIAAAVAPAHERTSPLETSQRWPWWLDGAVVLLSAGMLGGWLGVSLAAIALVAVRKAQEFEGWAVVGAIALMTASAGLAWALVNDGVNPMTWVQLFGLVAVVATGAALAHGSVRLPTSVRLTHSGGAVMSSTSSDDTTDTVS